MKKHLLFLLFAIITIGLNAQVDSKYLQGAVPEVDGKITFSKSIKINNTISDNKIFDLMSSWAESNYNSKKNPQQRVLLSNSTNRTIACKGEKDLVFKSTALSLDKSIMSYQLILQITGGECIATIKSIRFNYIEQASKQENYTAEEMISDKVALKGEKLNRFYDKFRIHTIDSINSIFNSIDVYLNGVKAREGVANVEESKIASTTPAITTTPLAISVTTSPEKQPNEETPLSTSSLAGYRLIAADKIPGNIIKLLNEATLITSGSGDNVNVMTASWGGLGVFWGKPVSFCFLGAKRHSISTMDKGDTYTISFYTEAYKDALQYCGSTSGRNEDKIKGSGLTPIKTPSGATAFSEAWMIFECKKMIAQPLSQSAIADPSSEVSVKWVGKDLHKMYIGEIINVWVK